MTRTFSIRQVSKWILRNTVTTTDHLSPEIKLHLITARCPLWMGRPENCPYSDPYWAFYWPGGQVLSRFLIDNPSFVRNKSVLDIGCGCGASSIAALMGSPKSLLANDTDEESPDYTRENQLVQTTKWRQIRRDELAAEIRSDSAKYLTHLTRILEFQKMTEGELLEALRDSAEKTAESDRSHYKSLEQLYDSEKEWAAAVQSGGEADRIQSIASTRSTCWKFFWGNFLQERDTIRENVRIATKYWKQSVTETLEKCETELNRLRIQNDRDFEMLSQQLRDEGGVLKKKLKDFKETYEPLIELLKSENNELENQCTKANIFRIKQLQRELETLEANQKFLAVRINLFAQKTDLDCEVEELEISFQDLKLKTNKESKDFERRTKEISSGSYERLKNLDKRIVQIQEVIRLWEKYKTFSSRRQSVNVSTLKRHSAQEKRQRQSEPASLCTLLQPLETEIKLKEQHCISAVR